MAEQKKRKPSLKRLSISDKLAVELDLYPRLRDMYESLYSVDPENWNEEWVVTHIRAAFGSGMIARADKELVARLKAMGYALTR